MKLKRYYLLTMSIIFIISVISSTISVSAQANTIKNPDSFVSVWLNISNNNLDPAVNYEFGGYGINELVLETLVDYYYGDSGELTGKLAQSVYKSEDGLSYTFKLRQNVKYQDGTAFNAYTMKYSLDRAIIVNDRIGPEWMIQQIIKGGPAILNENDINVTQAKEYLAKGGIEVIDDYTLKINLLYAYEPFLSILANRGCSAISPFTTIYNRPYEYNTNESDPYFGMVSLTDMFPNLTDWTKLGLEANHDPTVSGIVPQAGRNDPALYGWYWDKMVGTGPYKIAYHNQNIEIKLKKNTNWWGTFSIGAPDNIVIKKIPDVNERITALKNGDVDSIPYTPELVNAIIDEDGNDLVSGIKTYMTNSFYVHAYTFNMYDSFPSEFIIPANNINTTWNATEIQAKNLIRFQYDPNNYASVNNPFTARLFRKAFIESFNTTKFIQDLFFGFATPLEGIIPDGMYGHNDQLFEKGFIPTFNYSDAKKLFQEVGWRGTINLPYHIATLTSKIIFETFKAEIESMNVGIQISLIPMDDSNFWNYAFSHNLPIYSAGWYPDYSDPQNYVVPYYVSGFYPFQNGYYNPYVNEMAQDALTESNQSKRSELYSLIEENASIDLPYLYLYQALDIYPVRDWNYNVEESGSLNPMSSSFNYYWMSKGSQSEVPPICPLELNVDMALCEAQLTSQASSSTTTQSESSNSPGLEVSIVFVGIITYIQMKKRKS